MASNSDLSLKNRATWLKIEKRGLECRDVAEKGEIWLNGETQQQKGGRLDEKRQN